jgi:oligopeptidase B
VRIDNYFWLRERENPEVRQYLEAESRYFQAEMAHTQDLQERLFGEFKARIRQTDVSVPYLADGYYHYSRTEAGKDYPVYCRRKASLEAPEQILVDVNALAVGHEFCSVPFPAISPDGTRMVYAMDTAGRRFYSLHFQDLATGQMLPEVIPEATFNVVCSQRQQDRLLHPPAPGQAALVTDLPPRAGHRSGRRHAGVRGTRRHLQLQCR